MHISRSQRSCDRVPDGPAAPGRLGSAALALALALGLSGHGRAADAAALRAGAAAVDVTDRDAGPANDPLAVKALVLRDDRQTAVVITVDAVALAEIGPIRGDYMTKLRARLEAELGIDPGIVLVNASHCHGVVCADVVDRTVRAVRQALANLTPVKAAAGSGREDRIMENRRLRLKDGREADVRHAYALPAEAEVASAGPVDPEIGLLRLDRVDDGRTLAVVYNFACHPIQGVPGGGNTADLVGFASRVIEANSGEGSVALFLQGCGGDINPIFYKDVNQPRDAEALGVMLGLSTLKAARELDPRDGATLAVVRENLALPRADFRPKIARLEAEHEALVRSLRGTSLNLKEFLALSAKYAAAPEFPSYASHRYLRERAAGRDHLDRLDAENRKNMEDYRQNIYTMEQITRTRTNLDLLRKHQADNAAAGSPTVEVELMGLRVGEFALVTFPGELTAQVGLNIKAKARAGGRATTFVAGYTNGYIYYAPTSEQLRNPGHAQEDCDTILAPEWQPLFEAAALGVLGRL